MRWNNAKLESKEKSDGCVEAAEYRRAKKRKAKKIKNAPCQSSSRKSQFMGT
jgi:hypothetical protein